LRDNIDSQKRILNELDECCRVVYKEFIQAGYHHLEEIKKFPNWNAVVNTNGKWLNE